MELRLFRGREGEFLQQGGKKTQPSIKFLFKKCNFICQGLAQPSLRSHQYFRGVGGAQEEHFRGNPIWYIKSV